RRVVSWGRSSNVFLRNGSRLYLDVGSHPEYAPAEGDDLTELVVHDKAGERILEGLLVDAEQRLAEEGVTGDIYLFKNNTDSAGNSYGCHQNYLVGRHGGLTPLGHALFPPHRGPAGAQPYGRLHVIVGDSNMNETTTLLKVTMTDLVLRMIEAGVPT